MGIQCSSSTVVPAANNQVSEHVVSPGWSDHMLSSFLPSSVCIKMHVKTLMHVLGSVCRALRPFNRQREAFSTAPLCDPHRRASHLCSCPQMFQNHDRMIAKQAQRTEEQILCQPSAAHSMVAGPSKQSAAILETSQQSHGHSPLARSGAWACAHRRQ